MYCVCTLGWSPVTRKILDIEFIPIEPIYLLQHECLDNNEIFLAALVLQNRLKHMFDASVFDGISDRAPNEFLMNYGLAEAVLYSMRLYDIVVKSLDDALLNEKSEEAMAFVLSTLSYDGDYIGRFIPQFYFSLESVRMGIIHKIGDLQKQQQQILQKYHGLKDTYLRENFANVKANACSVFFDQNLTNILDMYIPHISYTNENITPDYEYLRTLDNMDDADSGILMLPDGDNDQGIGTVVAHGQPDGISDEEVESLLASDTVVVDDNCFNADGSRLDPSLCFIFNKQKALFDRDRAEELRMQAAKAAALTVPPTSKCQQYQ